MNHNIRHTQDDFDVLPPQAYFPLLIRYSDTGEHQRVEYVEDIDDGRQFIVEQTCYD